MGFSVSGAAAIIFTAMFIAFGMWYTASANSFEQVTEAKDDQTESITATTNAAIEITSATYFASEDNLTVEVDNTGATQLSLDTTDVIVDGEYQSDWQANATVAGERDTDLWLATEQLSVNISLSSQPDRVKVVAETGVADTAEVTAG